MGRIGASNNSNSSQFLYDLILTRGRKRNITLKMVVSGGDEGEAVITIMLPEEG